MVARFIMIVLVSAMPGEELGEVYSKCHAPIFLGHRIMSIVVYYFENMTLHL